MVKTVDAKIVKVKSSPRITKENKRSKKQEKSELKEERLKSMELISKLGSHGKDAQVYSVLNRNKKMAIKLFKKSKKIESIEQEIEFQKKIYKLGLCPKPYSMSSANKYISMQQIGDGETLWNRIVKHKGKMSVKEQKDLIEILEILDYQNIFHGDVSASNFLFDSDDSDRLYIIDFGMSNNIDEKFLKKNGKDANIKLGLTFFIVRVREEFPEFQPKLLLKKVQSLLDLPKNDKLPKDDKLII